MMSGIIDSDSFDRIVNDVKINYLDLVEASNSLNSEFEQLASQRDKGDLISLYTGYRDQLDELEKINNKVQNYHNALVDIMQGYANQGYEIARGVNLYLSKIKEELEK